MPTSFITQTQQRLLTFDWLWCLIEQSGIAVKQYGSSSDSVSLTIESGETINGNFRPDPPYIEFSTESDKLRSLIAPLAAQAYQRAAIWNLGTVRWYLGQTLAKEPEFALSRSRSMSSHNFETMTAQVRILGWVRLAADVLVNFEEKPEDGWDATKALFVPNTFVNIYIRAPGPRKGMFSDFFAQQWFETIASICAFAMGRPLKPPFLFDEVPSAEANDIQMRSELNDTFTLARKGVPLNVWKTVAGTPDIEHFDRMRMALRTHNAALEQDSDSVACVLYVAAMDALCSPRTKWRTNRMVRRYIDFFDELIADCLDAQITHANFEEAFQIQRGTRTQRALRREVLKKAYSERSGHIHEGLSADAPTLMQFSDSASPLLRGFLYEMSEMAILEYHRSPRSSLVGHPNDGLPA